MNTPVISTERLALERLTHGDAAFIVELLTDADWLRYIGDRGVRSAADAIGYLDNGPLASYAAHGFGLYRVTLHSTGEAIGLCGLLKRDALPDVDIGYAFLPSFRGHGYAFEAASATLRHAREALGLTRIVAIVSPENAGSIRVLQKLGMTYERMVQLRADASSSCLYAISDPATAEARPRTR